jgi:hypothetical protein
LPDHAGSGYADLLDRVAHGGVHVLEGEETQWELRE